MQKNNEVNKISRNGPNLNKTYQTNISRNSANKQCNVQEKR
jgi:hypothetical protein